MALAGPLEHTTNSSRTGRGMYGSERWERLENFRQATKDFARKNALNRVKVDKAKKERTLKFLIENGRDDDEGNLARAIGSGLYDVDHNFGRGPSVTKNKDVDYKVWSPGNVVKVEFQFVEILSAVFDLDKSRVDAKMLYEFFRDPKRRKPYFMLYKSSEQSSSREAFAVIQDFVDIVEDRLEASLRL
ncbi:MAG: hypothetical protein M1821_005125 [Bathelium mastoideum]|nr:MAG: hypothetical protein M1821_005125 [Bathelium mastoideum]